jgi:hypothetical protein
VAGAKRKSALNFKVLGRRLAPVRNFLVFDNLPFIESAEPRSLDRTDVDKHIFAAARRLNEPYPFVGLNHFTVPLDIICSESN